MSRRSPIDVVTGLRNTRRSMGDGTIQGRVRNATPYRRGSARRVPASKTIAPSDTRVQGWHLRVPVPAQTWAADAPLEFEAEAVRNVGWGNRDPLGGDPTRWRPPRPGYCTLLFDQVRFDLDPNETIEDVTITVEVNGEPRWSATGRVNKNGLDQRYVEVGDVERGDAITVATDTDLPVLSGGETVMQLVEPQIGRANELWELVFVVENFGITWDGTNWWTTDHAHDVDPALFRRDVDGTVLDSYSGYDTASTKKNRGIVFDGADLRGVANQERCWRIDTSDGSTIDSFAVSGDTTESQIDITFDGTDLWITEASKRIIRRFSTDGTLQETIDHPTGRTVGGIAWTGEDFWVADGDAKELVRIATDGTEIEAIPGPRGVSLNGVEIRDGDLYVMTDGGLYRRQPL